MENTGLDTKYADTKYWGSSRHMLSSFTWSDSEFQTREIKYQMLSNLDLKMLYKLEVHLKQISGLIELALSTKVMFRNLK
jgi:hypothetical protein